MESSHSCTPNIQATIVASFSYVSIPCGPFSLIWFFHLNDMKKRLEICANVCYILKVIFPLSIAFVVYSNELIVHWPHCGGS